MENAEKRGEERGVVKAKKVFQLYMQGRTKEEIAQECNITVEDVDGILK